jgi:hypothetical protein
MPPIDLPKADITPHVSVADASAQDHSMRDTQFPGLFNDALYLWAMVDTENGKRYGLFRALSAIAAIGFSVHECSTDRWTYPQTPRSLRQSNLYWGQSLWLDKSGRSVLLPLATEVAEQHPIAVELGPTQHWWKEDDIVDVELAPLPMNVTAIHLPGPPGEAGYTSSGCLVSGSVAGSRVTGGYGGLDRMYAAPGLCSYLSKTAMLENYWIVWASLMKDGSWQTGNVFLGEGALATATFSRPGHAPVIETNECVRSTVVWDARGERKLPRSAKISFGGHTFLWEPTHNAIFAGPSARFAHLYGIVQEQGAPPPVKSWSTMEIILARAAPRSQI